MAYLNVRRCAACGSANRVPSRHLADAGRCGACEGSLPPASEPIEVDREGFDAIIEGARVPVLVDFWAEWCGPCRAAAREVRSLAQEMAGRALVLKVNTEEQPELAQRFRVQSIPNFVVIRNGQTVFQQPGLVPRSQMKNWLEASMTTA